MSVERQFTSSLEAASTQLLSLELLEKIRDIPCGTPETYGATPLDHASAYEQQCQLLDSLQELVDTDIPEGIPTEIAEYMRDTFAVRFHSRGIANHDNFLTALHNADEFADDPVVSDIILRAKLGHASPAELLIVRDLLGIRSAELACLTHPYGKRVEYVEPMRDAVRQSVEALGGAYFEEPTTRYRVKGVVNEMRWDAKYTQGFFMTRKRDLGLMPDGTIIRERTSYILRSDTEGAVPGENLKAIRELDAKGGKWQDDVVRIGHLDEIAATHLAADEFLLVIPVSTTIYAFNAETAAEIAAREEQAQAQRREELQSKIQNEYPALFAHLQQIEAARQQ